LILLGTLSIAFYWRRAPEPRPSEKDVSAAQDEIYEAVIHDIITPSDGRVRVTQLVFGEAVLTPFWEDGDASQCEARARKQMWLENAKLPYDTLLDKAYRFFTHDSNDDTLRPDTIQDFLKKFRTPGQLSRTFHYGFAANFCWGRGNRFRRWSNFLAERATPRKAISGG
jgi:hypothetical protein